MLSIILLWLDWLTNSVLISKWLLHPCFLILVVTAPSLNNRSYLLIPNFLLFLAARCGWGHQFYGFWARRFVILVRDCVASCLKVGSQPSFFATTFSQSFLTKSWPFLHQRQWYHSRSFAAFYPSHEFSCSKTCYLTWSTLANFKGIFRNFPPRFWPDLNQVFVALIAATTLLWLIGILHIWLRFPWCYI